MDFTKRESIKFGSQLFKQQIHTLCEDVSTDFTDCSGWVVCVCTMGAPPRSWKLFRGKLGFIAHLGSREFTQSI